MLPALRSFAWFRPALRSSAAARVLACRGRRFDRAFLPDHGGLSRKRLIGTSYPQYDLLGVPALRWLGAPPLIGGVRVIAVAIFLLTIAAGLFGEQSAYSNIIVTLVWVIFWAGFAFFASLVGNIWQLVNPIRTLYAWGERIVRGVSRKGPGSTGQPYPGRPYPRWLGVWPGILFFVGFAWSELIWGGRTVPRDLALAVIAYSAVAWLGMAVWGRETWLRHGDAFTLAFGVLARFAPLAAPSSAEAAEARPLPAALRRRPADTRGRHVLPHGLRAPAALDR